ncbi:MAG: sensor histidine kinase [Firmicutes bacterium]|nr:sensor histidine kinase [Bacillota bacterium]
MELFLQYLKHRRKELFLVLMFFVIFIITFALYDIPLKAVLYPAALCLLMCIIFTIADFARVKKKHEDLTYVKAFSDIISDKFPAAESVEGEDYQRIIRMLMDEHSETIAKSNKEYMDMVEYFSIWAHQIKTPIASMKLTLQNEDSPLSRKLSNQLLRIEQYVEMVMTFLRLNSESTDYVIKEYDIDSIIRQALKKFSGEFIERKLSLDYEPLNVSAITDEKWLSFVIEQVLSNSLKYTPSGSIRIALEAPQKLSISDTGIGIAKEDLPRVFQQGYTGYNGRTDNKASGIGLYLCKCICTKLGHNIEIRSQVDKGTTVTIDLSQQKPEIE